MNYINPYEIADSIYFNNLDLTTFKKFKRRLSAELELNDSEIIINNVLLQKNEINETLDKIDKNKNLLDIYYSIYENKELSNFLNESSNIQDFKKLKNILSLEDSQTIKFITPYLIEILSKIYKNAYLKNQESILQTEPPVEKDFFEQIYAPIYKLLKNQENELMNLKNEYYDLDDIRSIIININMINILPDYFLKIRSDITMSIRNLSIDSWNNNENLELALDLIKLALKFDVNSNTKDKLLSDQDDLKNIKQKILSEEIVIKINNLQNEDFQTQDIISKVKRIINNTYNNDIISIAIRDLSIFSWNKKEAIELALKLNNMAINISESQDILKILNKDKKDLLKIKKDNTCWYCNNHIAMNDEYYATLEIWKYEETGALGSIVGAISGRKYFKNTIPVPRCKKCYQEHNNYGFFDFGLKKDLRLKTAKYLYEIPELCDWNIGSGPN